MFLKDIKANQPPVLIEPTASSAPAFCANFHPEKSNLFVVAFRDGTIAAYDTDLLPKTDLNCYADQERVNRCEISHFRDLHQLARIETSTFPKSSAAIPVTGTAFLPGFKARAVTVGSDGRCKLIDFANEGIVLRTWHTKAPLTAITILKTRGVHAVQKTILRGHRTGNASFRIHERQQSTDSVIAVGCADGRVQLYSPIGLLLGEHCLNHRDEKILSVEWASGPAPKALDRCEEKQNLEETLMPSVTHLPANPAKSFQAIERIETKSQPPLSQHWGNLGLPASLRKTTGVATTSTPGPTRKFTIHPDEIEYGTVRQTPSPKKAEVLPNSRLFYEYHDLFSPVKIRNETRNDEPTQRISSPLRTRPRISSQTFTKAPESLAMPPNSSIAISRNLTLFPSTDTNSNSSRSAKKRQSDGLERTNPKFATQVAPLSARRSHTILQPGVTFTKGLRRSPRKDDTLPNAANAKLLADLRKFSNNSKNPQSQSLLSAYANPPQQLNQRNQLSNPPEERQAQPRMDHPTHRPRHVHVNKRDTWPTDSVTSTSFDDAGGDIWITSDSDEEPRHEKQPGRTLNPIARSLEQEQRSRGMWSNPTRHAAAGVPVPPFRIRLTDGSTDEAMFTAHTHVSPEGTFSPASEDVRELFPRSSSLTPRKKTKQSRKSGGNNRKPWKQAAATCPTALSEETPNTALKAHPSKSPWIRAKTEKLVRDTNDTPTRHVSRPKAPETRTLALRCTNCTDSKAKVHSLEGEVAQLKAEVLALKSALRRNGLPFPACLR